VAFGERHLKLTFGGQAFQTEIWQTGVRLRLTGTDKAMGTLQDWAEANIAGIGGVISSWRTAGGDALWSNKHRIDWAKLVPQDLDGSQGPGNTPLFEFTTPLVGANNPWPAQNALVASTLTAANRGLAHRGRMYWPYREVNIDLNGDVAGTETTTVATQTSLLLKALNNYVGTGTGVLQAAVLSNVASGSAVRQITGVTCGNVPDTQRRRRNALAETYTGTQPV